MVAMRAITTLLALSALLHTLVAWALLPDLQPWPWAQGLALTGFLLSAALIPAALIWRGAHGHRLAQAVSWLGMGLMGLFSSVMVLALIQTLLEWVIVGLGLRPAFSSVWVLPLALLITLCGLLNARRTAKVVKVDVPIRDLPPALHGFSIAQISDIHVGPTIKGRYLQAIVDKVNALGADMVAVTGDLVDGSVRELATQVAPLAGLSSRHGTFFVTGNHEYYSGAHSWIDELRRLRLTVLMNEHVVLTHGSASVVLAGVADYSAHHFDPKHRSDPQAALAGAPPDAGIKLLLAHQPRTAPAAAQAGFDLQLSGHTHGGQFLPWTWFVRLQQPFTAGLHRLQGLWVYVSRGTGYWGPPKRFGAPSEITHLRLVPQIG